MDAKSGRRAVGGHVELRVRIRAPLSAQHAIETRREQLLIDQWARMRQSPSNPALAQQQALLPLQSAVAPSTSMHQLRGHCTWRKLHRAHQFAAGRQFSANFWWHDAPSESDGAWISGSGADAAELRGRCGWRTLHLAHQFAAGCQSSANFWWPDAPSESDGLTRPSKPCREHATRSARYTPGAATANHSTRAATFAIVVPLLAKI